MEEGLVRIESATCSFGASHLLLQRGSRAIHFSLGHDDDD
jgi:hypothetical protein